MSPYLIGNLSALLDVAILRVGNLSALLDVAILRVGNLGALLDVARPSSRCPVGCGNT